MVTLNQVADTFVHPELREYLGTILYQNQYLFLNRWSFVHLGAGMLFYLWKPKDLKLWIKIVIIFEIIEFILAGIGSHPLFVESAIDIFWDIIIGIGGFWLMRYFKTKRTDFKWQ